MSGRLPLLLATLAENHPSDPDLVGDPTGNAVERFLKWEADPARKALALAGAYTSAPQISERNRASVAQKIQTLFIDDLDGSVPPKEPPVSAWTVRVKSNETRCSAVS